MINFEMKCHNFIMSDSNLDLKRIKDTLSVVNCELEGKEGVLFQGKTPRLSTASDQGGTTSGQSWASILQSLQINTQLKYSTLFKVMMT